MRIAILTESGHPNASSASRLWCDRLVRGLTGHTFDIYALTSAATHASAAWDDPPPQVGRVRRAPLDGAAPEERHGPYGTVRRRRPDRRERRRFARHFEDLATGFGTETADRAERFADGLYGLAALAGESRHLPGLLRSEDTVRTLERICRAPGALPAAQGARVQDLLAVTAHLGRALCPLSLDWYGTGGGGRDDRYDGDTAAGLGGADLCHATSSGPAALPALVAKRFFGTPLLVTEYGVRLREHYLAGATAPQRAPVRALLAAFQGALAAETYAHAALITPGNTHIRRWQERCGADPARLRTVYPGMDTGRFTEVPEAAADDSKTLVWVGAVEPAKDLVGLLHAFARVRAAEPHATLRIIGALGRDPQAPGYLAHCRALAAQLFPDEAADARTAGENPVSFEQLGGPEAPSLADAYASGAVLVLSSVVEGFPRSLVEAMFCGRATVSTDTGAVCEIIGGTGLVVPPRNPRALADACCALLGDPARRARLGAAARARALELFTVEQNLTAFRGIYLELISRAPGRPDTRPAPGSPGAGGAHAVPRPFARPAEAHVPGRWVSTAGPSAVGTGTGAEAAAKTGTVAGAGRGGGGRAPGEAQGRSPSWAAEEGRPVTDHRGHRAAGERAGSESLVPLDGAAPRTAATDDDGRRPPDRARGAYDRGAADGVRGAGEVAGAVLRSDVPVTAGESAAGTPVAARGGDA